ncbi:MAG: lytic murein transglycosylase [Bdellovibrionales bacterium]
MISLLAWPSTSHAAEQDSWYSGEKPPAFAPYPVMPPQTTNNFNATATLSTPETPAPAPTPPSAPQSPPAQILPPPTSAAPPPAPATLAPRDAFQPTSGDESFDQWLRELEQDAIAQGVSPITARNALQNRTLDERVVELDRKQPEKTITFEAYQARIVSADRVAKARLLYNEHAAMLRQAAERYGVPAPVILALWGIESAFGRNIGSYDVLDSLISLAYEGRRASFFRKELIEALHILDEERRPASSLIGSWAGALGQCQFMPSTFRRYAVDGNGDGARDIWNDTTDVFASIANYLAAEGWRRDLAWGREVDTDSIPSNVKAGLDSSKSLPEWNELGVRNLDDSELPARNIAASLIQPDGPDGRSFLVYDNYRAIMRWNRSTYFATAVGLLADRIGQ